MAANKEINLKVCIIGDNEVGKSSLVLKHIRDKFSLDYNATAGILFIKNKIIVDGKEVSMQVIFPFLFSKILFDLSYFFLCCILVRLIMIIN